MLNLLMLASSEAAETVTKTAQTNTEHIAANSEIIEHLSTVAKIYGPVCVIIIALLVYAWHAMEKAQDKMERAFIDHVRENDAIHDKIFSEIRIISQKLDTLIGEHNATHGGK